MAKRAAIITIISYFLLGFVSPVARYLDHARGGENAEVVYPFGPRTPGGILAHRAAVEADPPEGFSFRAGQPFALPPNWLTYQLHASVAMAAFAILSALLGFWVGFLTTGLSPPNRRNARWALGLASGTVFFVVEAIGGGWVRADPSHSAVLAAWMPFAVPLAGLGLLVAMVRRRWAKRAGPSEAGSL